mmetsp:Transcript_30447/g.56452  ORF Transcript_30447/g.56452 Transcript_30447/m.56452 type:complete len:254 (+) Transcript_30447:84-845(+)
MRIVGRFDRGCHARRLPLGHASRRQGQDNRTRTRQQGRRPAGEDQAPRGESPPLILRPRRRYEEERSNQRQAEKDVPFRLPQQQQGLNQRRRGDRKRKQADAVLHRSFAEQQQCLPLLLLLRTEKLFQEFLPKLLRVDGKRQQQLGRSRQPLLRRFHLGHIRRKGRHQGAHSAHGLPPVRHAAEIRHLSHSELGPARHQRHQERRHLRIGDADRHDDREPAVQGHGRASRPSVRQGSRSRGEEVRGAKRRALR